MPTFRNKISASCKICNTSVAIGAGWTEGPPWVTKCAACSGRVDVPLSIKVTLSGSKIVIAPNGYLNDRFQAYRAACEGAQFNGVKRCNEVRVEKATEVLARLREASFALDIAPDAIAAMQAANAQTAAVMTSADARTDEIDAILRKRGKYLFPFQKQGTGWLASKFGALLGDDMGLGKTIQILAALPDNAAVVVVCPAVAKGVWARETAAWRPDLKVTVLDGRGSFRWPGKGEIVVINPQILPESKRSGYSFVLNEKDRAACPDGLILVADEAHWLKHSKSQRTTRFRGLSEIVRARSGRVWLATATPVENKAPELWAILQAAGCAQEAFGGWSAFVGLMGGYEGRYGMEWGPIRSPAEVGERLKRVMLRRVKRDVLQQLPPKTHRTIPVEIDARTQKLCDKVLARMEATGVTLDEMAATLRSTQTTGAGFDEMSRARAALATAKIPAMLEMIEDYEEQGEPLVVFSAHRAPVDSLADRPGWAVITGDTPAGDRTIIEDRFQRGELKGVACTIKAGGVAITLTRAAHAIFVDREWNPSLNDQAEDRICRIGQDRGCVISNLVAEHALDERVDELLAIKREVIEASVEQGRHDGQSPLDVKAPGLDFDALLAEAKAQAAAADKARAEAEQLAKERTAKFGAEREKAEAERKEREEREKAEQKAKKNYEKRLARAKDRGWVADENDASRRGPVTPRERWAEAALNQLTAEDPDFASTKNGVGFNKADAAIGHWLTLEIPKGLTSKQWQVVIELCSRYPGQVGRAPNEEKVDATR